MFDEVAAIIKPRYFNPEAIFGLQCYLKSLKKLEQIGQQYPDLLVLPAHRLYYAGHWNGIQLKTRVNQLIQHHIERCAAILEILADEPMTDKAIARKHFEEKLLEGFGRLMAANEIVSHCELLIKSGDVMPTDVNKYTVTGTTNFERHIKALGPDY